MLTRLGVKTKPRVVREIHSESLISLSFWTSDKNSNIISNGAAGPMVNEEFTRFNYFRFIDRSKIELNATVLI